MTPVALDLTTPTGRRAGLRYLRLVTRCVARCARAVQRGNAARALEHLGHIQALCQFLIQQLRSAGPGPARPGGP